MNATSARARYGMTARLVPSSTQARGNISFGQQDADLTLTANKTYALRAIMATGSQLDIDLQNPAGSISGTTWIAGTAQVETATAVGTITVSGNMTVTVTAAGMTGSPKAISVAVLSADTASDWAAKVRTALAADADVSALFTVGGSTTAIVLTRKPVETFTVSDGGGSTTTLGFYAENDGTLNIALADDTSAGITEAATSADTTSGIATSGILLYDGDGKDFEGTTIPDLDHISGVMFQLAKGAATYANFTSTEKGQLIANGSGQLAVREILCGNTTSPKAFPSEDYILTITAPSTIADLTLTVFGNVA